MRGVATGGNDAVLKPNLHNPEFQSDFLEFTPTGFRLNTGHFGQGQTVIYMAIRRPNKPPEVGTDVFKATTRTGSSAAREITGVGFPPDLAMLRERDSFGTYGTVIFDRMRRKDYFLRTMVASSESTVAGNYAELKNDGVELGPDSSAAVTNYSTVRYIDYFFKRAPGFFDIVAYEASNQVVQNIAHNLNVEPELMIFTSVGLSNDWFVYAKTLGTNKVLTLTQGTEPVTSSTWLNNTAPTSSVFTIGSGGYVNWYGSNTDKRHIVYLFASLPGISKVGSYSGSSSAVNVDCGFTNGARFVLIKRTNANSSPGSNNGDWYVYDTARGIVSGNDPYIQLNNSTVEVTNTDYIVLFFSGFTISSF